MTSRLRELIQQLGEAIHESVIESEQIAGVVQDIRKHGFDVLLMLEATIGLNEVSKETGEADAAAEAAGGTFTKNDVNFLRSLRISIEGEDNDELPKAKTRPRRAEASNERSVLSEESAAGSIIDGHVWS